MQLVQTVPLIEGFDTMHKFGETPGFDAIDTNEEVWDGTGAYPFPSAAAATTIISDSSDDDGDPVGTGARTVTVQGLDSNYLMVSETATMNGDVGAVTLNNEYLRVYRAFVATAGSGTTNAGVIDIKHGATVIAKIRAGLGQTLMAVYTVPSDYDRAFMVGWNAAISANITTSARLAIQARAAGGAWLTKELTSISNTDSLRFVFPLPLKYPAQTDLRLRILSATSNNTTVAGGFDLILRR